MSEIGKWKVQIRKGYLELCILKLIECNGMLYGFDLMDRLSSIGIDIKEGTLYPLLNRMNKEKILETTWQTEGGKGHPRKFYSLTKFGLMSLQEMSDEYLNMNHVFEQIGEETNE